MDRRAFLGVAGAAAVWPAVAGEWLQPAAGLSFDEINSGFPKEGPTTVAEFNVWLRRKFNVCAWCDEGTAKDIIHHAKLVAHSDRWTREAEEDGLADALMRAGERQCIRDAVLRLQSAIDLNPKAFGADLWLRRAPKALVYRAWETDSRFMALLLRFSCSEELPGITARIGGPRPIFSKVDTNDWFIMTDVVA